MNIIIIGAVSFNQLAILSITILPTRLLIGAISSKPIYYSPGQSFKTFYARNLQLFLTSLSVCPWQAFQT